MIESGTILLGKYRIERLLGKGGMGVVALAHHLHLDEPMAIKFLLPKVLRQKDVVRRFLREAQAAVKLKSEHICRVFDVGTLESGAPYMVMEYLEGMDLRQSLKKYGLPTIAGATDLMLQACDALAEAHVLGIVHRDVKPANFFLTRRTDGSTLVKLLDFGISKASSDMDMDLTNTQTTLGTPAYMSPEQLRSSKSVDGRADIWALGVMLYEMVSGRRPFKGDSFSALCLKVAMETPRPLPPSVPEGFSRVVMRCLEKDPDKRFQTVGEMANALAPFHTGAAHSPRRRSGRAASSFDLPIVGAEMLAPAAPPPPPPPLHGPVAHDESGRPREPTDGPTTLSALAGHVQTAETSVFARYGWSLAALAAVLIGLGVGASLVGLGSSGDDTEKAAIAIEEVAQDAEDEPSPPGEEVAIADEIAEDDGMIFETDETVEDRSQDAPVEESAPADEPDIEVEPEARRFIINSDPVGATVEHDGEPVGETPFEVAFPVDESRTYEVVKRGHETASVTLPEAADDGGTVEVDLERIRRRERNKRKSLRRGATLGWEQD